MINKRAIIDQINNALPNVIVKNVDLGFSAKLNLGLNFTRKTWMSHAEIVKILNQVLGNELMQNLSINYYCTRSINELHANQRIYILEDIVLDSSLNNVDYKHFKCDPIWCDTIIKSISYNKLIIKNPLFGKDDKILSPLIPISVEALTIVLE